MHVGGVSDNGGPKMIWSDIKTNFHLTKVVETIKDSKEYLLEILFCVAIGFVAGYILKKFSSATVIVVLTLSGIVILQHFQFLELIINWHRLQDVLGIEHSVVANENVLIIVWAWIKMHLALSVSFLVAFLLGIRTA